MLPTFAQAISCLTGPLIWPPRRAEPKLWSLLGQSGPSPELRSPMMCLTPVLNAHLYNSLQEGFIVSILLKRRMNKKGKKKKRGEWTKLSQLRQPELGGIQLLVYLFPKSKPVHPKSPFGRWVLLPLSAPLHLGDHPPLGTRAMPYPASTLHGSLQGQAR